MTNWNSEEALAKLHPKLSLFLRDSAKLYPISGLVDDLFGLAPGELDRLIAVHILLDPLTNDLLSAAEHLIRTLPSSVSRTEEEMYATVRGPVDWSRTARRRYATGDPTLFVCKPTEKRYESPLANLLAKSLRECNHLGDIAFHPGKGDQKAYGVASTIRRIAGEAHRLRTHPKLAALTHIRIPSTPERVVESVVRRRPAAKALADFLEIVEKAFYEHDPDVVLEVLGKRLLAPEQAQKIFELQVGFQIIDQLLSAGFERVAKQLIGASGVPLFQGVNQDGRRVMVTWQTATWTVFGPRPRTAIYGVTRRDASMAPGAYIPDLIVKLDPPQRPLLVEVKLTEEKERAAESQGITEMLAYIFDAESLFENLNPPHGLVVAWNASGKPARSRVMVSDQNSVADAIQMYLNA